MKPQNLRRLSLNHLGQLPKNREIVIFGTPKVAHFLNFLKAVATVGAENFTQQSSNIHLMNLLGTPELSLDHMEQLQKKWCEALLLKIPPHTGPKGRFWAFRTLGDVLVLGPRVLQV